MGRRIKRSKKVVRTVSRKNSNRRMTQRRVNKRRVNKCRVNKRNMTKRNVSRRIKRTNRKLLKTLKRLRGGNTDDKEAKKIEQQIKLSEQKTYLDLKPEIQNLLDKMAMNKSSKSQPVSPVSDEDDDEGSIVYPNPLYTDDDDDDTSMEGGGYNRTNQKKRKWC